MNLPLPPEPEDIKAFTKEVRGKFKESWAGDDIDQDSLAVWYLNKIPSYLWKYWKSELEREGYTWQRFLKVIKLHTNDAVLWALDDRLSWNTFIENVAATLERYKRGKM